MKEVVRITLENEMDLILAHKRTMKLSELCGLSPTVQTTFATAVSEISRCVIGNDKSSLLLLGLTEQRGTRKVLTAKILTGNNFGERNASAVNYARRLASGVTVNQLPGATEIVLIQELSFSGLVNDARIESFIQYFKKELPLSPYDELRKKNIQLIEVSEKLRDSELQYKGLAETLPLMMFTTNGGGFILYANKWLKDYFGLAELEQGKLSWLNLVYLRDNRDVRAQWDETMLTQTPLRIQARLKTKKNDDNPLWHLISVVPSKNDQGQVISWTGFFVDIHAQKLVEDTLKNNTDLKLAQKQLLGSQKKLEEKILELNKSNHDLEQFAYIASHDLQEPLRKIQTFTELLGTHIDDAEKQKKYIEKIDQSSRRMSTLIKDVLDYSRLRKAESVFEEVSLSEVIDAIKVDMELLIEEKKAVLTISGLPAISGVRQQLQQLFYNLISNALKFSTADPQITISSRFLSEEEITGSSHLSKSLKYICIAVKDNGIGFDQKYAGQIFTIFKRLNTRDAYAGTGIGLALCKKIVDNHHGAISVESAPGVGTEFSIVLPV
jgi:PAS domain S-box-containing protein